MATARAVLQVFEEYQKARIKFVQTVAELAAKPQVSGRGTFGRHQKAIPMYEMSAQYPKILGEEAKHRCFGGSSLPIAKVFSIRTE